MILIFSHDDNDGLCSAAVAYRELKDRYDEDIICVEMEYGKHTPSYVDIEKASKVYILDFSFDKQSFNNIINAVGRDNVIWIDHHITAIEKHPEYADLAGTRREGTSGCLLTWQYFHPATDIVPYVVKLVNDWDIWKMEFGEETMNFHEYTTNMPEISDVKGPFWDYLLSLNKCDPEMSAILYEGLKNRNMMFHKIRKMVHEIGYPIRIEFDGKEYSCFKVNSTFTDHTSICGDYINEEMGYDIAWITYRKRLNDSLVRINQMRSKVVDVSKIAVTKGGGGHPNSSGWTDLIEKNIEGRIVRL